SPTSRPSRQYVARTDDDLALFFYVDTGTGDSTANLVSSARILCHALVAELPDDAISDALECLGDVRQFYIAVPGQHHLVPMLPGPVSRARIVETRKPDPVLVPEG